MKHIKNDPIGLTLIFLCTFFVMILMFNIIINYILPFFIPATALIHENKRTSGEIVDCNHVPVISCLCVPNDGNLLIPESIEENSYKNCSAICGNRRNCILGFDNSPPIKEKSL